MRPAGFQGGLPFSYHVGGTSDVRVHLKTEMDYQIRKIWNEVARIDGAEEKDRWVIMGNHRDAWTFGAVDPNSGSTAMLEAARGFGQLLEEWLEAQANNRPVQLGWGAVWADRFCGMGRGKRSRVKTKKRSRI